MQLVEVVKATQPDKKLTAIFRDGNNLIRVSFGSSQHKDYTIYYKEDRAHAEQMKNAYLARHRVNEDWNNPLTPGALSRWILWNKPTVAASVRDFKKRFRV